MNNDLGIALRTVQLGLSVITSRLMTIGCVLLTFGLFAYAGYDPDPWRIVGASIFALFSLVVIRSEKEAQRGNDTTQ